MTYIKQNITSAFKQTITNKQKALIHIAKQKLSLTDDEYKALLESFNVSSSKDLKKQDFKKLMQKLKNLGFKQIKKSKKQTVKDTRNLTIRSIIQVLSELKLSVNYANGIAFRMFGKKSFKDCSSIELVKIRAALNYHKKNKSKE